MTFSMVSNATSLGAQKNFMMTQKALGKSIGRLSSGLRIQSAADDAAGMGISNVMTADIRSVGQAERNANDAISMIQIAEGAMNEQNNIMARLRELAIQSANGALSANERAFIEVEHQQLVAEIAGGLIPGVGRLLHRLLDDGLETGIPVPGSAEVRDRVRRHLAMLA